MTTSTPASRVAQVMPPPGTTECSFGDKAYAREADGTFIVEIEALPGLLTVGGFELLALEIDEPAAPDVAR